MALNEKGGGTLVLVLMISVVMLVVSAMMIAITNTQNRAAFLNQDSVRAAEAAHTGVEDARIKLAKNPLDPGCSAALSQPCVIELSSEHRAEYTIDPPLLLPGDATISSTGRSTDVYRKFEVIYHIDEEGGITQQSYVEVQPDPVLQNPPVVCPVPPTKSADGLVSYWTFDEGCGEIAHDSSGSEAHGTLETAILIGGDTSYPVWQHNSCKKNGCLHFDGNRAYVKVENPQLPRNDFTYAGWVKSEDVNTRRTIFSIKYDYAGSPAFQLMQDNLRTFLFYIALTNYWGNQGSGSIPSEVWVHLAITRQGGTARTYVNGNLHNAQSVNSYALTSPCYLTIGSGASVDLSDPCLNSAYFWKGYLDELRIYNRALSQSEIQQIMNQ